MNAYFIPETLGSIYRGRGYVFGAVRAMDTNRQNDRGAIMTSKMKPLKPIAHKRALVAHLQALALELEMRPDMDWSAPGSLYKSTNGVYRESLNQRAHAEKMGLPLLSLTMGRTRYHLVPSPIALRSTAKGMTAIKADRFSEWVCDPLPLAVAADSARW